MREGMGGRDLGPIKVKVARGVLMTVARDLDEVVGQWVWVDE